MPNDVVKNPVYQELKKSLWSEVAYPREVTALIGEVEPWRAFCALPQDMKAKFTYPDHQDATDAGYSKRSKALDGRDDKEYFHIYNGDSAFRSHYGLDPLIESTPELKNFFAYTDEVYKKADAFAREIGKEIAIDTPGLAQLLENGRVNTLLRFLHYTPNENEEVIGNQHYDRSLYTLHLYESKPGLQFLNWDMQWSDAPMKNGSTVVFTGYRGEKLTSGELQKTWHRVSRKPGEGERYSAVLFVWSEDVESYDRDARAQDDIPRYTRV